MREEGKKGEVWNKLPRRKDGREERNEGRGKKKGKYGMNFPEGRTEERKGMREEGRKKGSME